MPMLIRTYSCLTNTHVRYLWIYKFFRCTEDCLTNTHVSFNKCNERLVSFGIRPPKNLGAPCLAPLYSGFGSRSTSTLAPTPIDGWKLLPVGVLQTRRSRSVSIEGSRWRITRSSIIDRRASSWLEVCSWGGGNFPSFLLSCEEAGYQNEDVRRNRFIGCKIDSSERSFGRTFISNEPLTAVTCRHSH